MSYVYKASNQANSSSLTIQNVNNAWGVQVGDIIVGYGTAFRATNATAGDISFTSTTTSTAWNNTTNRATSTRYKSAVAWMRVASADVAGSSTLTYTIASSSSTQMTAHFVIFRDRSYTTSPWQLVNTAYTTSDTTVRAAAITPTYANSDLVWAGWYYLVGTNTLTVPTDYTEGTTQETAATVGDTNYRLDQPASSTGNVDSTAGATCTVKHAFLIALHRQPTPAVSSLNPSSGYENRSISGVVITGTALFGATAVTVGGHAASSFTVDSDTQITATFPSHTAEADLQVQVTGPGGSSSDVAGDNFTYLDADATVILDDGTDYMAATTASVVIPEVVITQSIDCTVSAPVGPLTLSRTTTGLLLYDDFSTDTEANYNIDGHPDNMAVTGGSFTTSTTDKYKGSIHRDAITTAKCVTTRSRENTVSNVFDPVGLCKSTATFDSTYHHLSDGIVMQSQYGAFYLLEVNSSTEYERDSDPYGTSYSTWYIYRLYVSGTTAYLKVGTTALANNMSGTLSYGFTEGEPVLYSGYSSTPEWDWIDVRTSHQITCSGMTTGHYLRVSDGTTTAEAQESGGTATVDAGLVLFPLASIQIRTASGGGGSLIAELTSSELTNMGGGDYYAYSSSSSSATAQVPIPTVTATTTVPVTVEPDVQGLFRNSSGLVLWDDFSTDTSANYSKNTGTLSVSGGQLNFSVELSAAHKTANNAKCVTVRSTGVSGRYVGPGLWQSGDLTIANNVDGYYGVCNSNYYWTGMRLTNNVGYESWTDSNNLPSSTSIIRMYLDASGVMYRYGDSELDHSYDYNYTTYTSAGYPGFHSCDFSNTKADDIHACTDYRITFTNIPTGYYGVVTDGTTYRWAAESGGTATVDAGDVLFPLLASMVYDGDPAGAGEAVLTIVAPALLDMCGGDAYQFGAYLATASLLAPTVSGTCNTVVEDAADVTQAEFPIPEVSTGGGVDATISLGTEGTFGSVRSLGSGNDVETLTADEMHACQFTLASAGAVVKLTAIMSGAGNTGSQNVKGVIYTDSTNAPSALLGVTQVHVVTQNESNASHDLAFATPVQLSSGTYWLGVVGGTVSANAKIESYHGGGKRWAAKSSSSYTSPPSTFGTPTETDSDYELYIKATYTEPIPSVTASLLAPTVEATTTVSCTATTDIMKGYRTITLISASQDVGWDYAFGSVPTCHMSGVQENDVIVFMTFQEGMAPPVPTGGTGSFTRLDNGGAGDDTTCGWKRAGATSEGTYVFNYTGTSNSFMVAAFRGCVTTDSPIDDWSDVVYVTNDDKVRAGTVDTTVPKAMLVAMGMAGWTDFSWTAPGGMTEIGEGLNTNYGENLSFAYGIQESVGATGNKDFDLDSNTAAKHAYLFALSPEELNYSATASLLAPSISGTSDTLLLDALSATAALPEPTVEATTGAIAYTAEVLDALLASGLLLEPTISGTCNIAIGELKLGSFVDDTFGEVSSGAYINVDKPTVATGDIILAFSFAGNGVTHTMNESGWNLIDNIQLSTSPNVKSASAWWRPIVGGEPSSWRLNFSGSTYGMITLSVWRGFTSSPIHDYSNSSYIENNDTIRAASVDTTLPTFLVWLGSGNANPSPSVSGISGYTEDVDLNAQSSFYSAFVSHKDCSAWTGSTGNVDGTLSATMTYKHAMLVALQLDANPVPSATASLLVPSVNGTSNTLLLDAMLATGVLPEPTVEATAGAIAYTAEVLDSLNAGADLLEPSINGTSQVLAEPCVAIAEATSPDVNVEDFISGTFVISATSELLAPSIVIEGLVSVDTVCTASSASFEAPTTTGQAEIIIGVVQTGAISYINSSSFTGTAQIDYCWVTAPNDVKDGDILFCFAYSNATGALQYPPGFTEWATNTVGTSRTGHIGWKRANNESGEPYLFHKHGCTAMLAHITVLRGCQPTGDPKHVAVSNTLYTTSDTICRAASIDTTESTTLAWCGYIRDGAGYNLSAPESFTNRTETVGTGCVTRFITATKSDVAAGTTGNIDGTCSTSSVKHAFLVALEPADVSSIPSARGNLLVPQVIIPKDPEAPFAASASFVVPTVDATSGGVNYTVELESALLATANLIAEPEIHGDANIEAVVSLAAAEFVSGGTSLSVTVFSTIHADTIATLISPSISITFDAIADAPSAATGSLIAPEISGTSTTYLEDASTATASLVSPEVLTSIATTIDSTLLSATALMMAPTIYSVCTVAAPVKLAVSNLPAPSVSIEDASTSSICEAQCVLIIPEITATTSNYYTVELTDALLAVPASFLAPDVLVSCDVAATPMSAEASVVSPDVFISDTVSDIFILEASSELIIPSVSATTANLYTATLEDALLATTYMPEGIVVSVSNTIAIDSVLAATSALLSPNLMIEGLVATNTCLAATAQLNTTSYTKTFGSQVTAGGGWGNVTSDGVNGTRFTLSEHGLITKGRIYLNGLGGGAGTATYKFVIYDNNGTDGRPGTLMGYSDATYINQNDAAQWFEFTFSTPVSLTAGEWWLMDYVDTPSTVTQIYRDFPGGYWRYLLSYTYTGTPPNPCPEGGSYSEVRYSFNADYVVSGIFGDSNTSSIVSEVTASFVAPSVMVTDGAEVQTLAASASLLEPTVNIWDLADAPVFVASSAVLLTPEVTVQFDRTVISEAALADSKLLEPVVTATNIASISALTCLAVDASILVPSVICTGNISAQVAEALATNAELLAPEVIATKVVSVSLVDALSATAAILSPEATSANIVRVDALACLATAATLLIPSISGTCNVSAVIATATAELLAAEILVSKQISGETLFAATVELLPPIVKIDDTTESLSQLATATLLVPNVQVSDGAEVQPKTATASLLAPEISIWDLADAPVFVATEAKVLVPEVIGQVAYKVEAVSAKLAAAELLEPVISASATIYAEAQLSEAKVLEPTLHQDITVGAQPAISSAALVIIPTLIQSKSITAEILLASSDVLEPEVSANKTVTLESLAMLAQGIACGAEYLSTGAILLVSETACSATADVVEPLSSGTSNTLVENVALATTASILSGINIGVTDGAEPQPLTASAVLPEPVISIYNYEDAPVFVASAAQLLAPSIVGTALISSEVMFSAGDILDPIFHGDARLYAELLTATAASLFPEIRTSWTVFGVEERATASLLAPIVSLQKAVTAEAGLAAGVMVVPNVECTNTITTLVDGVLEATASFVDPTVLGIGSSTNISPVMAATSRVNSPSLVYDSLIITNSLNAYSELLDAEVYGTAQIFTEIAQSYAELVLPEVFAIGNISLSAIAKLAVSELLVPTVFTLTVTDILAESLVAAASLIAPTVVTYEISEVTPATATSRLLAPTVVVDYSVHVDVIAEANVELLASLVYSYSTSTPNRLAATATLITPIVVVESILYTSESNAYASFMAPEIRTGDLTVTLPSVFGATAEFIAPTSIIAEGGVCIAALYRIIKRYGDKE